MCKKRIYWPFILTLFFILSGQLKAIVKWTDNSGHTHYAQSIQNVPHEYREQIVTLDYGSQKKSKKEEASEEISEPDQRNHTQEPSQKSYHKDYLVERYDFKGWEKNELTIPIKKLDLLKTGQLSVSELYKTVVVLKGNGGIGSGVIITPEHVLTNYHVIEHMERITVITNIDTVTAEVVRASETRDVALLKIPHRNDRTIADITSTAPEVGDELLVLGSPLDEKLKNTLTKGILSAVRTMLLPPAALPKGRKDLKMTTSMERPIYQTDANINPGNSGGPVFNQDRELVALSVGGLVDINTKALLGINYLIPIESAFEFLSISHDSKSTNSLNTFYDLRNLVKQWLNYEIKLPIP